MWQPWLVEGCWNCTHDTSWTSMVVLLRTLMNSAKATDLNCGKCVLKNLSRTESSFSLKESQRLRRLSSCTLPCLTWTWIFLYQDISLDLAFLFRGNKEIGGKLALNRNLWIDEIVCLWFWSGLFIHEVIWDEEIIYVYCGELIGWLVGGVCLVQDLDLLVLTWTTQSPDLTYYPQFCLSIIQCYPNYCMYVKFMWMIHFSGCSPSKPGLT